MRSLFKHLRENPFIFFAGLAALVHSVWTLDVMFGGPELNFAADPFNAGFRKLVALFMAFTIDIGQIQTSVEIRNGQRNRTKYLTFFSFAAATYLLQWIYLVHHVETLTVGTGVSPNWNSVVRPLLDLAIWIIPGLLPASTLLYTFSQASDKALVTLENGIQVLVDRDQAQGLGASGNGGAGPGIGAGKAVPALPVPNRGRRSQAATASNTTSGGSSGGASGGRVTEPAQPLGGVGSGVNAGNGGGRSAEPYGDEGDAQSMAGDENLSSMRDQHSGFEETRPDASPSGQGANLSSMRDTLALTVAQGLDPARGVYESNGTWVAVCPYCGWKRDGYKSAKNAQGGLNGHAPYCKAVKAEDLPGVGQPADLMRFMTGDKGLWDKTALDRLPQGFKADQIGFAGAMKGNPLHNVSGDLND